MIERVYLTIRAFLTHTRTVGNGAKSTLAKWSLFFWGGGGAFGGAGVDILGSINNFTSQQLSKISTLIKIV